MKMIIMAVIMAFSINAFAQSELTRKWDGSVPVVSALVYEVADYKDIKLSGWKVRYVESNDAYLVWVTVTFYSGVASVSKEYLALATDQSVQAMSSVDQVNK